MKIALLVIGSEVLEGKISDLNTRFLAEYLRSHHLELHSSLTARDTLEEIHAGLDFLQSRCDLIITCGGLGPTRDDLTKEALATYLNREIKYSAEAFSIAEANYQRMGRPYPGKDHTYSFLPEGFMALNNHTGFAPGLFTEHKGKLFFSAPGVPRELKSMVEEHFPALILPRIKRNEFMETVILRTRKVPEEKIFGELDPDLWDKLSAMGEVSSLPVLYGVDIGIKLKARSEADLMEKKQKVLRIKETSPISSIVWHIGPESLEQIIISRAKEQKLTFGLAESATGGLCSHRLTNIPGSSEVFLGSVICYDTEVKKELLQVKQSTLQSHTVVSTEAAQEMAAGVGALLKVDLAISITGYAGPGGGTAEKPVGTVCIGSWFRGRGEAQQYHFRGDRELLKNRFSQVALMSLLEQMEEIAGN